MRETGSEDVNSSCTGSSMAAWLLSATLAPSGNLTTSEAQSGRAGTTASRTTGLYVSVRWKRRKCNIQHSTSLYLEILSRGGGAKNRDKVFFWGGGGGQTHLHLHL